MDIQNEFLLPEQRKIAEQNKANRANALKNNPMLQRIMMGATRGMNNEMAALNTFFGSDGRLVQDQNRIVESKRFVETMCNEMNEIQEKSFNDMQHSYYNNQQPPQPQQSYSQPYQPSVQYQQPQPPLPHIQQHQSMDINDYLGTPEKKKTPANVNLSDVLVALGTITDKLEMVCKLLGTIYQKFNIQFETIGEKTDKSNDYLKTLVNNVPPSIENDEWEEEMPELGEYGEDAPLDERTEEVNDSTPEPKSKKNKKSD